MGCGKKPARQVAARPGNHIRQEKTGGAGGARRRLVLLAWMKSPSGGFHLGKEFLNQFAHLFRLAGK